MTTRASFVDAARAIVSTPFHAGGRCPGVGVDCIGVVICAAHACGINCKDYPAYSLRPNGQLIQELDKHYLRVRRSAIKGDVLVMAFNTGEPHHVAVHAGDTLIHAYFLARKCVEQPITSYWMGCTKRVYCFPEFGDT